MNNATKALCTSFALLCLAAPLQASTDKPVADKATSHIVGKAWVKNEQAVKLFNIFLRSNPVTLYRIQKSTQTIRATAATLKNVTKTSPAEEAAFVKAQIDKSLELVKPFIEDIHGFRDIITPLLNESQLSRPTAQRYLTDYLSGTDTLEEYISKKVRTVEQLDLLFQEIQGFFADLFASLSKETKDAYKAFLEKNSTHHAK